jgi:hypothetical protein
MTGGVNTDGPESLWSAEERTHNGILAGSSLAQHPPGRPELRDLRLQDIELEPARVVRRQMSSTIPKPRTKSQAQMTAW